MLGMLKKFREDVVFRSADDEQDLMTLHFEMTSLPMQSSLNLADIRFIVHSFAGGAHGNCRTETVDAILDPYTPLRLSSVFLTLGESPPSDCCVNDLVHLSARDRDRVKSGADGATFQSSILQPRDCWLPLTNTRSIVMQPDEAKWSCLTQ